MGGGGGLSGRAESGLPQEAAQGLAAQGETLDLAKFLAQVVIVEAGIGRAGQTDDGLPHSGGDWVVRDWRAPELPRPAPEKVSLDALPDGRLARAGRQLWRPPCLPLHSYK